MPKSKRARVVPLTKTKSRGRARKDEMVETIQKCCDEYKSIYVFSCDQMRSDPLKRLRMEMKDSRFFFGKNKVMRLAFGKSKEEAYLPHLETLSEVLRGEVGVLFTNNAAKDVEAKLGGFEELDYAKSGVKAPIDVMVSKGPIEGHPSSMYEPLRKMLLPVVLNKGVIELEQDHYVCKKGDVLTPEQAAALKFFDHKLSKFKVRLLYRWRGGELTELEDAKDVARQQDEEMKEEDDDDEELDF